MPKLPSVSYTCTCMISLFQDAIWEIVTKEISLNQYPYLVPIYSSVNMSSE